MAWECFLILLAIAFLFLLRHVNHKEKDNKVIMNWPIVGNLPSILLNYHRLHDWFVDILSENGCTYAFKDPLFGRTISVITCDPENVNHMVKTQFANFTKGSYFAESFGVLGDGILTAYSDSWRNHRKMALARINHRRFRRFLASTTLEKVKKGLIPVLLLFEQQGGAVDLQDVLKRFTFDSTCTVILGADPGCLSVDLPTIAFAKAAHELEEAAVFRYATPKWCSKLLRWLQMGHERKLAKARQTVDHFMAEHISRRKEELSRPKNNEPEQEEEEPTDILTSYIENQLDGAPSDQPKSDKFLRDAMLNLLVAGKDTTSAALTWFFWLLSKNPNVETKILDELRAHFSSKGGAEFEEKLKVFDIGDVGGLVYLHAALCESLRLFPAVPLFPRVARRDDVLPSGEKLRRGRPIFCSIYAMGRMKSIWGEDCLEFKPERWISEEGTLTFEHNNKFLVFSTGPRTCVGKDIAFTQMKVVVASLLYNFKFHVIESQAISIKLAVVLPTKNGLMVKVKKRDQSNNV